MLNDFSDVPIPVEIMDVPEGAPDVDDFATDVETTAPDAASLTLRAMHLLDAEPERWRIRDDDAAEWAGRHLAAVQREIDELNARKAAFVEKIEKWHQAETAGLERRRAMFEAHLRDYALRERAGGRKSFRLPSVWVETRDGGAPRVEITDRKALLAWAQSEHPEIVEYDPKVLVTTLRTVAQVVEFEDGTRRAMDNMGCPVVGADVLVPDVSVNIYAR